MKLGSGFGFFMVGLLKNLIFIGKILEEKVKNCEEKYFGKESGFLLNH